MNQLKARKVYYQIEEKLGAGLTSEVFKAIRRDDRGWTRQSVALKIIKSQNDVQIFKTEFESLVRLRSKNCVELIAWENLQQGPALVLEYIDGVTLQQLERAQSLNADVLKEIFAQCRQGLFDLRDQGRPHGDLNPSNIMINRRGVVKLIDFGFQGRGDQICLTPGFASPNRLSGGEASFEEDLFSLHEIIQHYQLTEPLTEKDLSAARSQLKVRRQLAEMVDSCKQIGCLQTRFSKTDGQRQAHWLFHLFGVFCFLVVLFFGIVSPKAPVFAHLEFRSHVLAEMSINGLPPQFAPQFSRPIRAGTYKVEIKSGNNREQRAITLSPGESFLLQPSSEDL